MAIGHPATVDDEASATLDHERAWAEHDELVGSLARQRRSITDELDHSAADCQKAYDWYHQESLADDQVIGVSALPV